MNENNDNFIRNYKTLNDASVLIPELAYGHTQVWYRKVIPGFRTVNKFNLSDTHEYLGNINLDTSVEHPEEKAFRYLQGCNWSPRGEAVEFIKSKGLHTSMSVGDILVIDNIQVYICKASGFEII
jgi:hypothetical protein